MKDKSPFLYKVTETVGKNKNEIIVAARSKQSIEANNNLASSVECIGRGKVQARTDDPEGVEISSFRVTLPNGEQQTVHDDDVSFSYLHSLYK